jgi:phosphatidylglycerol:prolipoprotein diacylglycerol transferase
MLPYIRITEIHLGPVTLQAWGLLVALGLVLAGLISIRRAKREGLDAEMISNIFFWSVVAGFIGARLGHFFLYDFSAFAARPVILFEVWRGGWSSLGGYFFGLGYAALVLWRLRMDKVLKRKVFDALLYGFPLGLAIGRVGCALIHDHPGRLSDFYLAVAYPGGARFDLGLYESVFLFLMVGVFFLVRKKFVRPGMYSLSMILIYSVVRFFLDFMRADDGVYSETRFLGLTPAQFGMIIAAIYAWRKIKQIKAEPKVMSC